MAEIEEFWRKIEKFMENRKNARKIGDFLRIIENVHENREKSWKSKKNSHHGL